MDNKPDWTNYLLNPDIRNKLSLKEWYEILGSWDSRDVTVLATLMIQARRKNQKNPTKPANDLLLTTYAARVFAGKTVPHALAMYVAQGVDKYLKSGGNPFPASRGGEERAVRECVVLIVTRLFEAKQADTHYRAQKITCDILSEYGIEVSDRSVYDWISHLKAPGGK